MEGGWDYHLQSLLHPGTLPDKFEAGTMNYMGIAGLAASLKSILETGIETIRAKELSLTEYLLEQLVTLDNITVYGKKDIASKVPVVSFTHNKQTASEIATILDDSHAIIVRPGLQCAPLIHKTLGTSANGTVSYSLGSSKH